MKNQEFKIDTKSGVVVFCQEAHGKVFTSKTKATNDEFNIGIGQLIAMKRNEIEIRKVDIKSMLEVAEECKELAKKYYGTTGHKLYANFAQIANDKVNMSRNHIRELKSDLKTLYNGTYDVKPYAEIMNDRKKGVGEGEKKTYAIPTEIKNGTHIFDVVHGSAVLIPIEEANI